MLLPSGHACNESSPSFFDSRSETFFRTNYDRWQKMAGAAENRVEVVSNFFSGFRD